VVELSKYRAQLGRGRRLRRADLLFESADPRAAVRALPGDEFFYVVHELGFPEAIDVLAHATPEQVQTALDFAVWDRDTLSLEKLETWLDALAHLPFDAMGRFCKGLDVELLAVLLRKRARIYDLGEEGLPDEPEGVLYETPDRFFALDLRGSEDEIRVSLRLLESIYSHDKDWARRILVGARGELDAELEELAYRWRSGRMADLGFEDYYAALEVYRELDPASVRIGEAPAPRVRPLGDAAPDGALQMPTSLAERLATSSPFARAVAGLTDAEDLANVHAALVALANRVLSADRVTPGDEEAMTAQLGRMAGTLDLAVELLAKGQPEEATRAVRSVPLVRLHQLGMTLLGKVKRLALTLRRGTPLSKLAPEIELLEDDDAAVIAALTRLRPVFPALLDTPPGTGERPFASLADLALATAAVERAGAALNLLYGLGLRVEHLQPAALPALGISDPRLLDAGLLARTIFAHHLIGRTSSPPWAPLAREDRARLEARLAPARKATAGPGRLEELRQSLVPALSAAWPGGHPSPAALAVAERWLTGLVERLPVLGTDGGRPAND
jgi:hypothetical protein